MTACRLRTENGEELLSLDELEERLRAGDVAPNAWIQVPGLTQGYVRLRDSPLATREHMLHRARFRTGFALNHLPILSGLVALTCMGLHALAEVVAGGAPERDVLLWLGARSRSSVLLDGEVWRLWTGALLHRDRWHLGFNVLVLMAVGGALESIYRRSAHAALLLWGALGSALLSLWLGPAISVGLSGVVFAMLGALVGFGTRFRDVLPRPYQRWFGGLALGYALFALWTGARTPEVDHPGHLGGLLTGLALGLVLPPRRWHETSWLRHLDPGALIVALIASGITAGALWGHSHRPRPTTPYRASNAGVVLPVPEGFTATRDAFGLTAFDNGLDAQVALGCARAAQAWPRWRGNRGPAEAVAQDELAAQAPAREVHDFEWSDPHPTTVGLTSWPAQEVRLRYRVEQQWVDARLIVWERGLTHCALTLATRAHASPRRAPLLDSVRHTLELVDPAPLVHARDTLRGDPTSTQAMLDLGLAAMQSGEFPEARASLHRVLATAPESGLTALRAHFALAQLAMMLPDGRDALTHAIAAQELAAQDPEMRVLLVGVLQRHGAPRR
ncbi:MAG: rhomboid family intramembrane serine protease [Myxococcota bacterium]